MFGETHPVREVIVHTAAAVQHPPIGCTQRMPVQVDTPDVNVPGQSEGIVTEQVPSAKQHAPVWPVGQGVGVQETPTCHVEMPAQAVSSTDVHAPVLSLQHAPTSGTKQGLGVHEGLVPQRFGTAQFACTPTVQVVPAVLQQVPVGGSGHGFGVHEVAPPTPPLVHTPPEVQAVWMPYVQAPVWAMQHVPVGGCGQ